MVDQPEKLQGDDKPPPPHMIVIWNAEKKSFTHQFVGDIPFAELNLYLEILMLNNKLATIQANAKMQAQEAAKKVQTANAVPKTIMPGRFP
jgi:hypothetical protein